MSTISKNSVDWFTQSAPNPQGLAAQETDTSDGLRLAWPSKRAWLHVRPSGTEPVVRLIAEAPGVAEARALVRAAAERLEGIA